MDETNQKEKNTEPAEQNNKTAHEVKITKRPRSKTAEYISGIIFNLIFLYVAKHLLDWDIAFIKSTWADALPIIIFSTYASIIGNVIMLAIPIQLVRYAIQQVLNLIAIYVMYALFLVFPFDFSAYIAQDNINEYLRYVFLLGIVGIIIGIIVQTIQLFVHDWKKHINNHESK